MLGLDNKQSKDKPPTEKIEPPKLKHEPQKSKFDLLKQRGEKEGKSKPPTDGG